MNETASYCMNMDGFKDDRWDVFSVASVKNKIWLPRLDQLLAEIERRGFRWDIGNLGCFGDHDVCIGLFDWEDRTYIKGQFYADTPEDAAAQALLWLLEQERD